MNQVTKERFKLLVSILFFLLTGIYCVTADHGSQHYSNGVIHFAGWAAIISAVLGIFALFRHMTGAGPLVKNKGKLASPNFERNGGKAMIRVRGISEEELKRTITSFIELYSDSANPPSHPLIQSTANDLVIKFQTIDGISDTDYEMFCYWVNYITWNSEGQKLDVVGWYQMGDVQPQETNQIIGQRTLYFFIPEDETAADNVYITTPEGKCYCQTFDIFSHLSPVNPSPRSFEPMPMV